MNMKNILIFNDISGAGNCSLAANLPVLTMLGHYCMPVPTAVYSRQTGFENYTVIANDAVRRFAADLVGGRSPQAVLVGFCNKKSVVDDIFDFLTHFNGIKPFVLVDPILGDNGKLYPVFNEEYAFAVKGLTACADVITPNLTEACLLCGVDYESVISLTEHDDYVEQCRKLLCGILQASGAKSAVVTGVVWRDKIYNLVFDGKEILTVVNNRVSVSYSGTGDVFSSVLLGQLLNGKTLWDATRSAADFVASAAFATECADRRFGVEFCRVADKLK